MSLKRYLGALRLSLVAVGLLVVAYGVYFGANIPEPPPNSDGVPTGFAVIYVMLVQAAGALLAQIGYALPAGTGRFRFGPLADRSPPVRAAAATTVFAGSWVLLTVIVMLLPGSPPDPVAGTHAFLWFASVAGTVAGVAFTAVVGLGTALWRLATDEPVLGDAVGG